MEACRLRDKEAIYIGKTIQVFEGCVSEALGLR